jgi:ribosome biogenesis GTPase
MSRQRPGGGGKQVLAANVDLITIVMGLDGDYNLRRLERYLVQAATSGAEAMVALNKMDLCAEWPGAPCRCTGHNEQHSGTVGARVRGVNR